MLLLYLKQLIEINFFTLFLQGTLFFLIYGFLILLFKGFDKKDVMIINSIKNKFTRIKR